MSCCLKSLLILLAGLLMMPALAVPVAWDEDGDIWRTRTSEHFAIHYRDSYDAMAQRALSIAERVHQELVPFFVQSPAVRTHIVLTDEVDYSNGWATPLPFSQIRLFASPPEDVSGLEHMDEWLHGLIRHEYVHTLHLNMSRGIVRTGRSVFGRFYLLFPHIFTPSLFTEGLAVYLETNHELGYGRLDGSLYAMEMRAEVASGHPDQLTEAVLPLRDWPLGKNYLYGAWFFEYLAQTYGEAALSDYLNRYSGQLIPYFLQNSTVRGTLGKTFPLLWQDYLDWLAIRFGAQSGSPGQAGAAVQSLPLLPDRRQVIAAAGDDLLVVVNNAEDRPYVSRWSAAGEVWQEERLTAAKNISDIDRRADGTLAVSRQIPYASGRVLNDVFLWSGDGGWQRLTQQGRFRKVRWSPDGQTLYSSRKDHGRSELWRISTDGDARRLWQSPPRTVLGGFDISPDGQALVAAVKRPQQGWNLERLDLTSLRWQPLTDSRATENDPRYLPDGRILYSADYDGVYNLFALSPQSGDTEQWTQLSSGAFTPQWLNGRVAWQEYTAAGYQLQISTPQVVRHFNIAEYQGRYDYPPAVTETVPAEVTDYSPWPTVRPHYWWPLLALDEYSSSLGLGTSGSDALGRHSYTLAASWDFRQDWSDFSATYTYDNRWTLYWQRTHSFTDLDLNIDDNWYATREDLFGVRRNHILDLYEDQLQLAAGLTADHEKIVRTPQGVYASQGVEETLAGLALTFDNREAYRNVPGTGWGSYLDLVYESNDVLNSDYNGDLWQAQWNHTFDLPGRQTLSLHAAGGWADQEAGPFSLGGLDSEESLLFGRDQFSLPGYDDHVLIGHQYYSGRLNYRAWLARVERNWGLTPFGLGDISADLWLQSASAWFRDQHNPQLSSVGAELVVDLVLGYSLAVPVRFGLAQGLDDERGKTQGYVRMQLTF